MSYEIQKGVPLPSLTSGRRRKYPFPTMEVGDSFLFNGTDPKSISNAAFIYGKAHSKKFTVRKTDDGYRCWRTK